MKKTIILLLIVGFASCTKLSPIDPEPKPVDISKVIKQKSTKQ